MKQKMTFSLVEWLKTLLIFVLIVLMLVLMILLMIGQNGTKEETLPQADRMVIYASGVQPMLSAGMDTSRVSPYLLAYRNNGGEAQTVHAAESVPKTYAVLHPLIRELFGAQSVSCALKGEEAKRLWSACADMSDYVYLCYVGALPTSVILAYAYTEEDSSQASEHDAHAQGDSAYIREMFLVSRSALVPYDDILPTAMRSDHDAICAVACDDIGNITLFYPSAATSVTAATVHGAAEQSMETGSGTDAAVASVGEETSADALDFYTASIAALSTEWQMGLLSVTSDGCGTAVSLSGLYRMPQVILERCDPSVLYADPPKMSAIFSLLGMRERDTDNYYTDSDGNRIYLNASGRLTVSGRTSAIRYDALQEGGLPLSDYLGYASIGGDYLLSEYLRAADSLLSRLEAQESAFGGDELNCMLIDVRLASEQAADTLVLTYGYTFRGIPLLDEHGKIRCAMVLQARNGIISHLESYPCNASVSSTEQYLLPQDVVMEALEAEHRIQEDSGSSVSLPRGLSMVYLCGSEDGYGRYSADWIGLMP